MPKKSSVYQVKIQRAAVDDLDEIYRFIRVDAPGRARRFLSALKRKILSLRRFPFRGSRARVLDLGEKTPEIRFLEYQRYLIFYIVEGTLITVLHVTRPGRDWVKLFL